MRLTLNPTVARQYDNAATTLLHVVTKQPENDQRSVRHQVALEAAGQLSPQPTASNWQHHAIQCCVGRRPLLAALTDYLIFFGLELALCP
jgi:hypothetical protein